jgi:RNA polymerase sigma-70 factor (ECF subfamily)
MDPVSAERFGSPAEGWSRVIAGRFLMIVPPSGSDLVPPDEEAPVRVEFDAELVGLRADVLGYLRGRMCDYEAAADIAQDAMLGMMRYREVPAEERRYLLFGIARNLLVEHRRTQRRRYMSLHVSLDDMALLQAPQASVEAIVDARMAIERLVKRVMPKLPPKCALAFALSRFEGLSYPQIAQEMGISVKAVEKHIARALVACRAEVEDLDFQAF